MPSLPPEYLLVTETVSGLPMKTGAVCFGFRSCMNAQKPM